MPSADQVPVKSSHSTMRWHMWVVLIACMFGSSKSWGLNSTHCFGTYVPMEEPSTASEADIGPPSCGTQLPPNGPNDDV